MENIEKRGQMKVSFGMIFSIILIVIFIAFAFWGIGKFLSYQRSIQIGQFINSYLQPDIDKMQKGSQGSVTKEYNLPSKIDYVCFVDFSKPSSGPNADLYSDFQLFSSGGESNIFLYPISAAGGFESTRINHIDTEKITEQENPYCIENIKGKVRVVIKIDIGETLVTLTR